MTGYLRHVSMVGVHILESGSNLSTYNCCTLANTHNYTPSCRSASCQFPHDKAEYVEIDGDVPQSNLSYVQELTSLSIINLFLARKYPP